MADLDLYGLTEKDYVELKHRMEQIAGKPRVHPAPQRRRRFASSKKSTSSTLDFEWVLVEDDIDGVTEDTTSSLEPDTDVVAEWVPGEPVPELFLYAYERQELDLKYFREAASGDPGYDPYTVKYLLNTEQVVESGVTYLRFTTKTYYYDDGASFTVGSYSRKDYPDYPEDETFPPDGTGTYDEVPEEYLKCKYRVLTINKTLVVRVCKRLPAPPLFLSIS